MDAAHVIVDFPGPGRNRERLASDTPRRIISAASLAEVRPALREAERAATAGAWVIGFVAYEAAPAFDAALVTRPHEGPLPLVWFAVLDAVEEQASRSTGAQTVDTSGTTGPLDWSADTSRADYDHALTSILDAIAAGDVYQVNHTMRFRAECHADPAAIFAALTRARHGRYHALIETPDWAIVSASPELFIDVRDGVITTRPMKGTARRGRWPAEDVACSDRLAHSAKDRAENLMIVDLLRNDFGRVARFGTVAVADMFIVETYPTVHQMTSTISARLREGVTLDDIFAATFPCGSVTGAPKIAAMQCIAALETSQRGAYCGAVGVLRPDGSATFNVAIRTLVLDRARGTAMYGAGGGITWDSRPDAEYDEVLAKAALLTHATPDFDLLETMRLDNGTIRRLDLHLERLAASARYWQFDADAAKNAADALQRVAAETSEGQWRVRMTVSRDAHVSVALVRLEDADAGVPPAGSEVSAAIGAAGGSQAAGGTPAGSAGGASGAAAISAAERIVALADTPIDSSDPLLHHKTTARAAYDERRAGNPNAFDVLLWNEHGCITEFTIGNIVCEMDGELVTPTRDAGLLGGTFREQLLRSGVVREADIPVADLSRVTRMWLVNSVREWVAVKLAQPT